jgi:hypothetical protein
MSVAKEQTRRSVSLNLAEFESAAEDAKRCGVSLSKYTEAALRVFRAVAGPELFAPLRIVSITELPPMLLADLKARIADLKSSGAIVSPEVLPELEAPPAAEVLARMQPELDARVGMLHPGGWPEAPPPPPAACRLCRRALSPIATTRGDQLCAVCAQPEPAPEPEPVSDGYLVVYDEDT